MWKVCTPDSARTFSATLFFFGRALHRALGTPVGLINSSVGGTPIELWVAREAQEKVEALRPSLEARAKVDAAFDAAAARADYQRRLEAHRKAAAQAKAEGKPVPKAPQDPVAARARKGDVGGLFHGKIAPLIPYAIRGAVWYQGEANTIPGKAPLYGEQLSLLVRDWRARWGQGDFPFAWVQLPNFSGNGRDIPTVREAMRLALALPNTGMAVTTDIGDSNDIHPKNKQDVGRRLAAWALGTVYGRPVVPFGPLPTSGTVEPGGAVRVAFSYGDGLRSSEGDDLRGFEVRGADGRWLPARARIEGGAVVVSNPDVPAPAAVRYNWANDPAGRLVNGAGLPMSPFALELKSGGEGR